MSIQKRKKTPEELQAEVSVSETLKKALKSDSTWDDKVRQHSQVYTTHQFYIKIHAGFPTLK